MLPAMDAKGLTPILNISDINASFAWFEKWDGRSAGTGDLLQVSARSVLASARFFSAREHREGADAD